MPECFGKFERQYSYKLYPYKKKTFLFLHQAQKSYLKKGYPVLIDSNFKSSSSSNSCSVKRPAETLVKILDKYLNK